ncbi:MAG TPA: ABC transporter permease subunit [Micromonosporaceae bacterium]|nr:ABC transporter permease subunit [Micromonosporaceae bacterium]
MRRTVHAEWTKLRTVPSTGWLLAGTVVATVGTAAVIAAGVHLPPCRAGTPCPADTTRLSLAGVRAGQVAVAVLAVLAVTGEYATGLVHVTLAATPRRYRALAAKVVAVAAAAAATGTVAVVGSVLVAARIFAARGYSPSGGYPLALTDPATARASLGTVCYLGLIAVLSAGVAVVVRDGAAALIAVLALLFAFPMATALVSDPAWQRRLHQWSPMDAGLAIQATRDTAHLPVAPWTGLGVALAWAAGATILGAVIFRHRDA